MRRARGQGITSIEAPLSPSMFQDSFVCGAPRGIIHSVAVRLLLLAVSLLISPATFVQLFSPAHRADDLHLIDRPAFSLDQ
jgi:hypothetical protein